MHTEIDYYNEIVAKLETLSLNFITEKDDVDDELEFEKITHS